MKKTFLARRNALLSPTDSLWGVAALTFALVAFFLRLLAPNIFWDVSAPMFRMAAALAAENRTFFVSLGNTATLISENEQLIHTNASLMNEEQTLLQKNADLSALIGTSTPEKGDILAGILARPPESPYDTLVLAAGRNVGVTLGMEALGAGGVPLGVITMVLTNFSRVTLFSSPGMSTAGWIGNAKFPLTIFGVGAGAMDASVPRAEGIAIGDTVFVPGPGALPIGVVTRIDGDPSLPTVTLRIVPTLNPFSITWVKLRNVGTALFKSFSATSTLP